jgi:preprotein translocase subunit SecA
MTGPYTQEMLANWAADFVGGDRINLFPTPVQSVAQQVLETLLMSACARRNTEPANLDEEDLKFALLERVARVDIDPAIRPFIPSLCRSYLEDLQRQGRLGSGQHLGRYVGALKEAFLLADRMRPQTYKNQGEKIGRNDPCPCGSGKKFKKCCQQE